MAVRSNSTRGPLNATPSSQKAMRLSTSPGGMKKKTTIANGGSVSPSKETTDLKEKVAILERQLATYKESSVNQQLILQIKQFESSLAQNYE